MSLLTHSEALTVSDAFLCSLYGDDLFGKWRKLKLEMRFVTERDYISWLLEVANCYRNNENLMQTTNNAESGKVEVVSQVCAGSADDNCNESQRQEPSDITLCQRELLDNADLNQPSTSHEYYEQRDGPVQKDTMEPGEEMLEGISFQHYLNGSVIKQEVSEVEDSEQSECSRKVNQQQNNDENVYSDKFMVKDTIEVVDQQEMSPVQYVSSPDGSLNQEFTGDADCLPTKMSVLQPRPCVVNMCDNNVFYMPQQLPGLLKRANHHVKKNGRSSHNHLSSPDCESQPKLKNYRSGDQIHKCNGCNYSSASITGLIRHKRTHSGEKPYRCDKCPYAAAQAVNLVTHKRTHTGEKPYRCDKCPYAAAQAGALVQHKRTHTGERPYRCDKCTYATARAGSIVVHKRTHTGEKPYMCDKCPYATARGSLLAEHKRTHTGEKPYRCDKCPYATAQAGNLVKHKRTHTGEKPYYRCV